TDWDILFQSLFDELLTLPPSVDHPSPEVITSIAEVVAPEPAASTGSPSSTTFDQDAPSPSNSQTTPKPQYSIVPNDDLLFQPLFDELFTPPLSVDPPAPEVIAPIAKLVALEPAESISLPSSTTVDQDAPSPNAPSPNNSKKTPETQSPIIPNAVEEDNRELDVVHMNNDLFFGIPILEVPSDRSSSTDIIHIIMHPDHQISEHISTRRQLHEQALFCYYDAFLTSVEPKTYKDALTKSCWIEAMQKELNELGRLEKYGFESRDLVDTPMVKKSKLDKDKEGKVVDPSHDRGMIGTLLYLTVSRPDL
nr:retrovirus-related Pol polyprotein from transposon TNT 1-94 [Tanacetum cinerariifolium]